MNGLRSCEVGELVQNRSGIRNRPGIPGMARKRKPIGRSESRPSPKRTMEDPQVSALRSPSQARASLAERSLRVDQPPDDQAAQVGIAPRLATAGAPIEDRRPAPPRKRPPDDRDLKDADIRDGQLDGRGRRLDVSLTISPIRDGRGTIVGASKVARDISAERLVEQTRQTLLEREQAARMEAEMLNRS